jgi:replicative DNA helicase
VTTVARDRAADEAEAVRVPPHDLDAERNLLGSMLLNRDAIGEVVSIIARTESPWFYREDHRQLFEVLIDLYDANQPMDLAVVADELRRRKLLEKVGGVAYVIRLAESVGSWVNAPYYARIVRDKGMLRDLIRCTGEIREEAYSDAEATSSLLDKAEQKLFAVTERRVSGQAIPLPDLLKPLSEQIDVRGEYYLTGIATGFDELDDITSGLQAGDFVVVAGRPSMGKTAFALNVAEHMAVNDGRPVAFFSMEMSKMQVAHRVLCSRSRIDSHKVRRRMLSEGEVNQMLHVCAQLESAPMYVDDTPGMSVLELRAKARRLKQQYNVGAVFVDYLQLMHCPGLEREGRQQEISMISRGLKALGRELGIPVIAMAQLNRAVESREGHRPRMSDLRESGAIEQDADVVLLLHREEYYNKDDPSVKNLAEVIVAKQRNGPVGQVQLAFFTNFTRFDNFSPVPDPGYLPPSGDDAPF